MINSTFNFSFTKATDIFKKFLNQILSNSLDEKFDYLTYSISLVGDRDENQDYQFQKTISQYHIMVLADGMGGHSGGKLAAEYFSERLFAEISGNIKKIQKQPEKAMSKLVSNAKKKMLSDITKIDPSLDPNTTFVATIISDHYIYVAHLGDSRCMIANKENFMWLTKDHSMLQLYLDEDLITEAEESMYPHQSKLLKAIGKNSDDPPDVKVIKFGMVDLPLYIFQMTDGFWQGIDSQTLQDEIINFENNIDNYAYILDNLAKEAVRQMSPGSDNTTVQLCRISKKIF